MWPFEKERTRITANDLAIVLWEWSGTNCRHFCSDVEAYAQGAGIKLKTEERFALAREVTIVHLWAISKVLGKDKRAMDALHNRYLAGHYNLGTTRREKGELGDAAQSELLERYDTYYGALGPEMTEDGWQRLSTKMTQFFFPQRKPLKNTLLSFEITSRIAAFMASTIKLRDRYKVIGT